MSKSISIHQPNFLPWIPYLFKMNNSDIHICLDLVEFSKNSWINRCCYTADKSSKYFTIPVKKTDTSLSINEVRISKDMRHFKKAYKTTLSLSKKYPGRENVKQIWDIILESIKTTEKLTVVNHAVQNYIRHLLGINTNIEYSADNLTFKDYHKGELVKYICKTYNASHYLTGIGSLEYLKKDFGVSIIEITPGTLNLKHDEINTVDFILKYGKYAKERFQEISVDIKKAGTQVEM